ncbi:transposase [Gluconacetobacter tumulisoli]|uniref:transposase n=1 Tax=Gluconacetobacter tumulisoli TaxID=1286189 RepID=UPI0038D0BEEA
MARHNPADGDLAYFTTWCPQETPLETLVHVEGTRWRIEESFETAKNEFGLDHNETRSWHGWHRHVSLVMLAYAMMAAVRSRANAMALKKASRTNATASRSTISSDDRSFDVLIRPQHTSRASEHKRNCSVRRCLHSGIPVELKF